MARKGTLTVRVIGDTKQLDKDLGGLGGKLGKFGAAAAAAGTAVAAGVGFSVKAFADFDAKMQQSIAIMGDVSDSMRKDMSDAAREVAKTTTFSAAQAAESYFFLASAGLDAEQSIAALPQVAAFAQAGMFDMATATDLATDAQSALGLTVDDAEQNLRNLTRVTDVFTQANNLANTSVEQISEAMTNKAGAAMRSVEMEIEEGAAVLAAFADQGTKGAEAGTQFAIVLRDLQTKALENSDAFKKAGVEVFDASGEFQNMGEIIGDLERRLGPLSDAERKAELAMLGFSDKSIAALQALIGTSDAIREYETSLRSAAGITQEVAEKQLQTFWAQVGLIRDQLVDLAISVGERVVPLILQAFDGVRNWWATNGPAIQGFVDRVGEAFATVFAGIQAALAVFRSQLDESVGVLGSWKESGARILAVFQDVFAQAFTTIGQIVESARIWINDNRERIVAWVNAVSGYLSSMGEMFAGIMEFIGAVVSRAIQFIRVVWDNGGKQWLSRTIDQMTAIANFIGGVLDLIGKGFSMSAAAISGDWAKLFQIMNGIVESAANAILGGIESMLNGIIRGVNRAIEVLGSMPGPMGDLFSRGGAFDPIELGRVSLASGAAVAEGFSQGVTNTESGAEIAAHYRQVMEDGVKTPTLDAIAEMPELGDGLANALANGVDAGGGAAKEAVEDLMAELEEQVSKGAAAISQILGQSFRLSDVRSSLSDAKKELRELQQLAAGGLDRQIAKLQQELSKRTSSDKAVTPEEALAIAQARDRVKRIQQDMAEAESLEERERLSLELAVAQNRLNEARKESTAVSSDTKSLEEELQEALQRRKTIDEEIAAAEQKVLDTQLDLITAQQRFNEQQAEFASLGGKSEAAFVGIAKQAGLTGDAIDDLVESFRDLMGTVDPAAVLSSTDWPQVAARINTSPAVRNAVIAAGVNPGSTTDLSDVVAAFKKLGISFGSQVNMGDLDALLRATATTMHSGGTVSAGMPRTPGLGVNERMIRAEVGEHITPRGGGGGLTIVVQGSVLSERDLVSVVEQGLRERKRRNGGVGF